MTSEVFDPIETLELICDTFGPQAAAKKIRITYEVCQALKSPDELNNDNSLDKPVLLNSKTNKLLPNLIGD